jgi:hypothetical protein
VLKSEVKSTCGFSSTIWQEQPNPIVGKPAIGMVINRVNSTDPVVQAR